MCERCDALLVRLHEQISEDGFAVVPVGKNMKARGWAYTIGLVDRYDHPELVIAGLPLEDAVGPLSALAACAVQGDRIDSPGRHGLNGVAIGTAPVHSRHLERGLMARWSWYYESFGRLDVVQRALQVVLPADGWCFHHQRVQPDLGSPLHVSFDGLGTSERRGCWGGEGTERPSRPPRSRTRSPDRIAPPATINDLYRHRRSARRRR